MSLSFPSGIHIREGRRTKAVGVWSQVLIDRWRDYRDQILQDLSERMWKRDLFKALPADSDEHAGALELLARTFTEELGYQADALDFYVHRDHSWRKSYRDGDDIWLIDDGDPAPLQEENSSRIISVVRDQRDIRWVMVKAEVEKEIRGSMSDAVTRSQT